MISAVILAATILGQKPLFQADAPYRSRAEFYDLTSKIRPRMSREDVIKILGKPDRITRKVGELFFEHLEYGIDPASDSATLGEFVIVFGKFQQGSTSRANEDFFKADEPYKQLIPEAELRPILGKLYESRPSWRSDEPLRRIRVANLLIKLGDKKAKFVLGEYERLDQFGETFHWYRWLLGVLFANQDVLMDLPEMLGLSSKPDLKDTITFYVSIPIRTRPVRPLSDPFEPLITALRDKDHPLNPNQVESYISDLLLLVRGVIQPVDPRVTDYFWKPNLEKYHELFMKESPTWDVDSQSYMRADGKILPDWPVPPLFRWNVSGFAKGTEFEISMSRIGETGTVFITFSLGILGNKHLPEMSFRSIDAQSKAELGHWNFKDISVTGSGQAGHSRGGNSPDGNELASDFELSVPRGTSVQFEVTSPSGTTRSSAMRL